MPVDSFWVEAPREEAEATIFPRLDAAEVAKSRELAERGQSMAERLGNPAGPFCFLVARDLSALEAFQVHYPFHQLWNAYSPFESMPGRTISSLEELRSVSLPSQDESRVPRS